MSRRAHYLWMWCALWCGHPAWPAQPGDRLDRERIATERTAVETAFSARERECQTRFIVTSCVEKARLDRRDALAQLRRQDAVLDEAQRRQRAAQRVEAIRTKISNEEARQPKPSTRERGNLAPKPAPAITGKARHADAASRALPAASEADRRGPQGSNKAAAFEARKQASQAHRDAVARRNAQKSAKAEKAALPLPSAASAP